jgi:hypothetical protein
LQLLGRTQLLLHNRDSQFEFDEELPWRPTWN